MATFVIPLNENKIQNGSKRWEPSTDEDYAVIQATLTKLMEAIQEAFVTTKSLDFGMKGEYPDRRYHRTMKYWRECNPAVAYAFDQVCDDLKSRGWSPYITMGRVKKDPTGPTGVMRYSGGGVYVRCDFN